MTGTLILTDWLIDTPGQQPKPGWGVRVVHDQIAAVAPHAELRSAYPDDQVVEAAGRAMAPGFVDAHTHLYGVLAHGIPPPCPPRCGGGGEGEGWSFLSDFWWPLVEDRLDREMICAATDLNCAAMLRSGITSFYDCTEAPNALPGCLATQAEIVAARGLRGILSFEATERVSWENGQAGLRENWEFIRSQGAVIRNQESGSENGQRSAVGCRSSLVSGMICYHTSFTCSAEFIKQAFELAASEGSLVHAHVSEGSFEPDYALSHFGMRPFEYYDQLGVTGPNMLASQCVQITPAEVEIIARRGVRVTHMPLSNCEVGGGIAPVPDLLAAGVTVGLGSDGYITDFFEVMRGAFLIHKAYRQDSAIMPAGLVWRLATEGGAQALGLRNVGRLAPGWQADLQLIDSVFPTPTTAGNLYDQLLLYRNHTHVRAVMVAGQWRVQDGVVLGVDETALRERTHRAARTLWGKFGPE